MSKITSHFAPVVPFHPTKRNPADGEIKTLRPKAECGDDWCLNGPPIEGASTYFLCGKCGRDSTNPVFLACVLKNENKRRPAPPPKVHAESAAPRPHPSPIPNFDFDFMIGYCLEHYGDFAMNRNGKETKMKFLNKAEKWLRYRYFIMADLEFQRRRVVQLQLRQADKLVREVITKYYFTFEDHYAAKVLYQLYINYGWVLYKAHPMQCIHFRHCKYDYGGEDGNARPIPSYQFRTPLAGAITEFYD